ncbi:putative holin-like toxin [Bacillus carboniphilus]
MRPLSIFESLSLMITFALLVIAILSFDSKK